MSKFGDDRAEPAPESIDWKETYEQLVGYGRRQHRLSLEDAKQVAQEAIRRFFDPAYLRYDPAVHGTVLSFLGSIVNALVANMRRRGSSSKWFLGFADGENQPRSPEDHAIAKERFERVLVKLIERTKHDPIARKLLAAMLDGAEGIEQEAGRVGVSIAEIEKARRRLKAHVEKITNSMGDN